MARPDKASRQVSEGAQNEPNQAQTSVPPTQSEINEMIEEQANPRIFDPPQQELQEELLPSVPDIPPALPEENQPTTMTRSGRAIHPMARYQQSLAQREQGIVAWEILVDQDEQEMIPTAQQLYELKLQMAEPIIYAASNHLDILYC